MRVPVLNKQQHKGRVRELKRMGCKVQLLERPEGTVVLRKCPARLGGLSKDHAWSLGDTGAQKIPKWFAGTLALAGAIFVFNAVKTADPKAA